MREADPAWARSCSIRRWAMRVSRLRSPRPGPDPRALAGCGAPSEGSDCFAEASTTLRESSAMASILFSPLALGPVTVPNRIAVSPMCQYAASDGVASDWHLQHLMTLAMSGAGLVVVEATGVERHGRISHGCLGLYSDACEYALARVIAAARSVALPGTKFAIQLSHAGRKASTRLPWQGGGPLAAGDDPWPTIAPSALPFGEDWPVPDRTRRSRDRPRDRGVRRGDAARRADRLRCDRAPCGPWLSGASIPFAALQPAQ